MECPHCNEYAPDNNYKCPHCGEVLRPDITPADFRPKPTKHRRINSNIVILAIIVVGAAVLIYAAFFKGKGPDKSNVNPALSTTTSGAPSVGYVVNEENPGQEIELRMFVQPNKKTIFDFYSEYCGPCKKISPKLKRLDGRREDIIIHKVDINRPGIRGIDWGSPVARQYNIHSVPYFVIYDSSGNLTHQGQEAYEEVMRLLQGNQAVVRECAKTMRAGFPRPLQSGR
jgi:thiol-disulfide isomerase/thioredoxin